jgi:HEPN domain-containing protein
MHFHMKTDLSHLPQDKQAQFRRIAERIREAVSPEMIILFGSHARGDWVADRYTKGGIHYEYVSDVDILVVVPAPQDKANGGSTHLWERVERQIKDALPAGSRVNAIAHNIDYLNSKLSEGHWFFVDIVTEGVLLYDSGRHSLATPRELPAVDRRRIAGEYYDQWFHSATGFYAHYQFGIGRGELSIAAFQLHQATERFYTTILLVFGGSKPKSHDLDKLGKLAATYVPELIRVFPRATDEEKRRFELLNRAYVEARYDPAYTISREDLEYLGSRVHELQALTEAACRRRIESLEG